MNIRTVTGRLKKKKDGYTESDGRPDSTPVPQPSTTRGKLDRGSEFQLNTRGWSKQILVVAIFKAKGSSSLKAITFKNEWHKSWCICGVLVHILYPDCPAFRVEKSKVLVMWWVRCLQALATHTPQLLTSSGRLPGVFLEMPGSAVDPSLSLPPHP